MKSATTTTTSVATTKKWEWPLPMSRKKGRRSMKKHRKDDSLVTLPVVEDEDPSNTTSSEISSSSLSESEDNHNNDETACCLRRGCLKKDNNGRASSSSKQRQRRQGLSVSFDKVYVREFPIVWGDNPSVSCGVPISVGWKPVWSGSYTVDVYDNLFMNHHHSHKNRRAKKCGVPTFTALQRFCMLRHAGFSARTIERAQEAAERSKRDRAQTVEKLRLEPLEEAVETFTRAIAWHAIFGKKRKERILLQQQQVAAGKLTTTT